MVPQKILCSEIASEAIFVLKFIFGLDAARIPGPSVFGALLAMFRDRWAITARVPAMRYGQKGHRPGQFEGGGTKRQILTKGGHVALVPPQFHCLWTSLQPQKPVKTSETSKISATHSQPLYLRNLLKPQKALKPQKPLKPLKPIHNLSTISETSATHSQPLYNLRNP